LIDVYTDNVTAMLLQWMEDEDLNGWSAYQAHVTAATSEGSWNDREYDFWLNYSAVPSEGPAVGDGFLLESPSGSFLLLEDGSFLLLE
jgi:hypothetical protein